MNNTYKNRSVHGMLITWIICLCLLLLLSVFTSCTSQKHLTYQRDTSDSLRVEHLQDSLRVVTAENSRLEAENKELRFASVEFDSTRCPEVQIPDCPDMLDRDSVNRLITDLNNAIAGLNNKVKVFADGTIEANGRLRNARFSSDKQSRVISEQARTIDSLHQVIADNKTQVRTETVEKVVHKKTSVFNFWWMLVIGAVAGYVIRARTGPIKLFKALFILKTIKTW